MSEPCADVIAIYEEFRRRGVRITNDGNLRCAHGEWEWHEVEDAAPVVEPKSWELTIGVTRDEIQFDGDSSPLLDFTPRFFFKPHPVNPPTEEDAKNRAPVYASDPETVSRLANDGPRIGNCVKIAGDGSVGIEFETKVARPVPATLLGEAVGWFTPKGYLPKSRVAIYPETDFNPVEPTETLIGMREPSPPVSGTISCRLLCVKCEAAIDLTPVAATVAEPNVDGVFRGRCAKCCLWYERRPA